MPTSSRVIRMPLKLLLGLALGDQGVKYRPGKNMCFTWDLGAFPNHLSWMGQGQNPEKG